MDDDRLFRALLIGIGVVIAPLAATYRYRSVTAEKLDRWQEGPVILFGLRLSGIPWLIGFCTWMVDSSAMEWSAWPTPLVIRWLGVMMFACSGLLMIWTFHNLGHNLTDTIVTRENHTLVTSGPYRYVRHPFYVSGALGMLGLGLATANWFLMLAGMIPLLFLGIRTRIEEQKLIDRFDDSYRDYIRRVGRFVPRIRG